jgi:hypothetical protein
LWLAHAFYFFQLKWLSFIHRTGELCHGWTGNQNVYPTQQRSTEFCLLRNDVSILASLGGQDETNGFLETEDPQTILSLIVKGLGLRRTTWNRFAPTVLTFSIHSGCETNVSAMCLTWQSTRLCFPVIKLLDYLVW